MRPARSGETGLPATSPERQVVGLDSSNEGSRMRSSNIVGTPCTIVTRSRRINASAPAASNRSCSTSVAPAVIVTATTCIPKIVNTGTAPSTRSSPVVPSAWLDARAVMVMLSCDTTTPLGFPIVPEVYRMARGCLAEARQRLGKRHCFPFDLRVGHPARPEHQKLTVRMLSRRLREEHGQMICRQVYHVPHSGVNL